MPKDTKALRIGLSYHRFNQDWLDSAVALTWCYDLEYQVTHVDKGWLFREATIIVSGPTPQLATYIGQLRGLERFKDEHVAFVHYLS